MEDMSLEQLEKLIKNPFYKLSDKQLERLDTLRSKQIVRHNSSFEKAGSRFIKNNTKIEGERGKINRD